LSHEVDEAYDLYHKTRRKARKEHRCCACGETILSGHVYVYVGLVWEGRGENYKRCLRCDTIFDAIVARQQAASRHGYADQWPDEDLNCGHTWRENFEEDPPEEVARLAFMSREEAQETLTKKMGADEQS